MACLFGLLAVAFPRLAFVAMWMFTDRVVIAFDRTWMALIGLVFLPWTAIAYTLAYVPFGGVSSAGWGFVTLAFFVDVYTYVRGGSREPVSSRPTRISI